MRKIVPFKIVNLKDKLDYIENYLKPGAACSLLGVTNSTMNTWVDNNIISHRSRQLLFLHDCIAGIVSSNIPNEFILDVLTAEFNSGDRFETLIDVIRKPNLSNESLIKYIFLSLNSYSLKAS